MSSPVLPSVFLFNLFIRIWTFLFLLLAIAISRFFKCSLPNAKIICCKISILNFAGIWQTLLQPDLEEGKAGQSIKQLILWNHYFFHKNFPEELTLINWLKKDDEGLFTCETCGKEFRNEGSLAQHKPIHREYGRYLFIYY